MPVLHYGTGSSVTLPFAAGSPPEIRGIPQGEPLHNPAAAVADTLKQPLDYPPLSQMTTPGDRVVIPLGSGIPQIAQVTAAVVETLLAAGIAPDGITVLRSESDSATDIESPLHLLRPIVAERIRLIKHESANRRGLAYLAASEGGEPILLNRVLTDADIVLPIGCMEREKTTGYFGIHSSIYPEYSDQKTKARFRKSDSLTSNGHHRELKHEVNHVAWILGVNFTIQVIPAAGDRIMHVLAGQSDAVRHRGRELYREIWNSSVQDRPKLVIAAIEGNESNQTWENVGRALEMGAQLVEDGGGIAVCCDLAAEPGPAIQRMLAAQSRDEALRHIRRDNPSDAVPAMQLAHALENSRVYLLSKLKPNLVEDLDMMPLDGPDELIRLAQRNPSCLVLANADRAMVRVETE